MRILHTFSIAPHAKGMSGRHSARKAQRKHPIKAELNDLPRWLLREPQAPSVYRRVTSEQMPPRADQSRYSDRPRCLARALPAILLGVSIISRTPTIRLV